MPNMSSGLLGAPAFASCVTMEQRGTGTRKETLGRSALDFFVDFGKLFESFSGFGCMYVFLFRAC